MYLFAFAASLIRYMYIRVYAMYVTVGLCEIKFFGFTCHPLYPNQLSLRTHERLLRDYPLSLR